MTEVQPLDFILLGVLYSLGPQRVKCLVAILDGSNRPITDGLCRLERAGLVFWSRGKCRWMITPAGHHQFANRHTALFISSE